MDNQSKKTARSNPTPKLGQPLAIAGWIMALFFIVSSGVLFFLWKSQVEFNQNCISKYDYQRQLWLGADWADSPEVCNQSGPDYDSTRDIGPLTD